MRDASAGSARLKIYNFLEHPKGLAAYIVQGIIFVFIFASVGMVAVEFFLPKVYQPHEFAFHVANIVILVVFSVEYLLRLITAPKKLSFVTKPMSIIDFLAIAPNYLEFILPALFPTTELRVLRLLRLLRFTRALRLLKLFRYSSFFKQVLQYRGTIFEAITPVLLILAGLKVVIIFLETHHWWVQDANLEQLFAIIGFALGIILSEKIEMTHGKFLQVENTVVNLYGTLKSLQHIIDRLDSGKGTPLIKEWTKTFLTLLHDPTADNYAINVVNEKLYKTIAKVEPKPADIHNQFLSLCQDAAFCLNKKEHLTPKAYDTLLHQATILYLVLIAVFIPGATGMISVLVAGYVLYGMYHLTQDMDSIIGGEFDLINIRTAPLEHLVDN